jgi:FAD/FMN-containing dehydrogenase
MVPAVVRREHARMLPNAPAFSFNLAVDLRAAAVAYPRNAIEVVAAVDHARAPGLRVAPQATGHNVGAYGSLDDAVLVDVAQPAGRHHRY